MTIAIQSQAAFSDEMVAKLSRTRFPFSGTFEITSRCNFSCRHCYLPAGAASRPELELRQVTGLLDELAGAGCLCLTVTGGEPLARPDFREIWSTAAARGFVLTLFTNASLIDESMADFLAAHPPRCVEVSLYGASPEAYREVTGVGGGFDRALAGIDRLRERGVEVLLKVLLTRRLGQEVDRLRSLADGRGLKLRLSPELNPTLEGDLGPLAERIEPRLGARLELVEDSRSLIDRLARYDRSFTARRGAVPRETVCGAGRLAFNVDPTGLLSPCLMMRKPAVDLGEVGFAAAWKELEAASGRRYEPCSSCEVRHLCGACPGLMASGLSPAPDEDDFHCAVARERAAIIRREGGEARGEVR